MLRPTRHSGYILIARPLSKCSRNLERAAVEFQSAHVRPIRIDTMRRDAIDKTPIDFRFKRAALPEAKLDFSIRSRFSVIPLKNSIFMISFKRFPRLKTYWYLRIYRFYSFKIFGLEYRSTVFFICFKVFLRNSNSLFEDQDCPIIGLKLLEMIC